MRHEMYISWSTFLIYQVCSLKDQALYMKGYVAWLQILTVSSRYIMVWTSSPSVGGGWRASGEPHA